MRLIIILCFVVLMATIMFGRNPIKEAQKAEIARRLKYGTDPLTRDTNMFIEKKEQESSAKKPKSNKIAQPDGTLPENVENVMVASPVKTVKIPDKSGNEVTPTKGGTDNSDGYYPPIVGDGSDKSKQNAKVQPENVSMKLRSGQLLVSEGTQVFTIDANGKKVVLPDGNYVLSDGGTIEISGGVRVVRTSPFE